MLPDIAEFEELVEQAFAEIPEDFREKLENVSIFVEEMPPRRIVEDMGLASPFHLLGLYEGVPGPARTFFADPPLPDRITLFRRPILRICRNRRQVVEQIRKTLVHEIAHHFGFSDEALRERGY